MLTESAISTIRTQPPLMPLRHTPTASLPYIHETHEIHETNRETTRNSQHTTGPSPAFFRVFRVFRGSMTHAARIRSAVTNQPDSAGHLARPPVSFQVLDVPPRARASASPPTAGQKKSGAPNPPLAPVKRGRGVGGEGATPQHTTTDQARQGMQCTHAAPPADSRPRLA